jgi:hypothetical protein
MAAAEEPTHDAHASYGTAWIGALFVTQENAQHANAGNTPRPKVRMRKLPRVTSVLMSEVGGHRMAIQIVTTNL